MELVPVVNTSMETHEVLDETAQTEEEDYKWLTERLDAHTRELTETRTQFQTAMEAVREANQNSLSESRTLIQALTEMVTSANQTLTALAVSAQLKSTPNNSENLLPAEEPTVIVENPASVAEENPAPKMLEERKRKRL